MPQIVRRGDWTIGPNRDGSSSNSRTSRVSASSDSGTQSPPGIEDVPTGFVSRGRMSVVRESGVARGDVTP